MAMTLTPLQTPFKKGQLLQHIDGGFYRYQETVYSSTDTSQKIIYKHIYPFMIAKWERPIDEFLAKFKPIEESVLIEAKQNGRKATQQKITSQKAERQAQK